MINSTEDTDTIVWEKPEYIHQEKTNDWYWALGVIVLSGSIASIIYENYFFAIFLVLSGAMMGYLGGKHPGVSRHELNEKGLAIDSTFFPYQEMISFWVRDGEDPKLFLKTKKIFAHYLSIPIETEHVETIKDMLLSAGIAEVETKEHPTENIMSMIGF